jgi:ribonuclease P protein component
MAERPRPGRGPRRRRLSRSAEFERVYRQGRSKANRYLVLYVFPRDAGDHRGAGAGGPNPGSPTASPSVGRPAAPLGDEPRLGLSVSRRIGGAVQRARVKRVLREAFWAEAPRLPAHSDYVVVARPEVNALDERDGADGVRRALAELIEEVGGTPADEEAVE